MIDKPCNFRAQADTGPLTRTRRWPPKQSLTTQSHHSLPQQSFQYISPTASHMYSGKEGCSEAQNWNGKTKQSREPQTFRPSPFALGTPDRRNNTNRPYLPPIISHENPLNSRGLSSSAASASQPINLTGEVESDVMDDAMDDAEFEEWLKSQNRAPPRIGRYAAYQSASISSTSNRPTRNLSIIHPFRTLASYEHNEILLRPGVCVELRDKTLEGRTEAAEDEDELHNDFIRIVDIIQDIRSQAVTIRGWIFQRASYLNGVIKKDRNEVGWIMHVDEDDSRDAKTQAMETVSVEDIIRRRRLILTNQPFPKLSFREDHSCLLESKEVIRNERILVCRYKYICFYISAYRRDTNTWSERVLERLRGTECDKSSAADDKGLRTIWRRETVPGGAYLRSQPTRSSNIIDLTNGAMEQAPRVSMSSWKKSRAIESTKREDGPNNGSKGDLINGFRSAKRPYSSDGVPAAQSKRHRINHSQSGYERPPRTISLLEEMRKKCSVKGTTMPEKQKAPKTSSKRQYTFNDYFCGAGGMSRAAHQNKLHIQDAFDFDQHACNSYHMNFPDARIHCLWAHEFIGLPNQCKCDIAHVSPVCKFFSPAHTRVGKDDEMNTASWTAIGELLMKSRPRVVTLEQTFGLVLRARHRGYLNALIQVFTSHGYSIRWRLLHCADYGLPQMRLRTFMIASWYVLVIILLSRITKMISQSRRTPSSFSSTHPLFLARNHRPPSLGHDIHRTCHNPS